MTEHNNPQAFPRPAVFTQTHGLTSVELDGMTLLDHFAGLAMQGVTANPEFNMNAPMGDVASTVYKMANAMLKEREKWVK